MFVSSFCRKVLSHSVEIFCRGTFQCLTNLGYRTILCTRGVCHDFLSENFRFTAPKFLVQEPFCVSEKHLVSKISKHSRVLVARFAVERVLWCRIIWGFKKLYAYVSHDIPSIFFCFTDPKLFAGEYLFF